MGALLNKRQCTRSS